MKSKKKSFLTHDKNGISGKKIKHFGFEKWHAIAFYLMIYDFCAVNGAYFLALWLRFDGQFSIIPDRYLTPWLYFIPIYTVICWAIFWALHLYQSLWKFASYTELARTAFSSFVTSLAHTVLITVFFKRMPLSYYIMGAGIQFLLVIAVRFSYRFILLERSKNAKALQKTRASRVMLIGAGSAGRMILQDLHGAKEINDCVCCIIDDDSNKWGRFIDSVPIVGGRDEILLNVEKYNIEKIFLAIPSASAEERRDILDICQKTDCELKHLPGMYQFVNGDITANSMKNVDVEDLLGRESVKTNMEEIFSFLSDKVILVTGGGGSIGSELCRQIAENNPKQLIIFDIYENNAHEISLELRDKFPNLNLVTLIGSVRDSKRINQVFQKYKPDVVYHAAAHKHVPLMEDSPCESIKNNAVGTYKTAYAAMMNGCQRFVLISTDKAVNPTNIMGASKRICEMIIQSFDKKIRDEKVSDLFPLNRRTSSGEEEYSIPDDFMPKTEFVAVRFGNVLGSNGSVIPRFKEQIAKGGPVTVTHPDIIRYFMTIPEAASLVLQAGTYAAGGEIFVLDMGSPVKIDTLARNLIRLSGLRPDVDIKIEYTGLRAGEKLYEEKLMSEEGMRTTPNNLIHIGSPIPFDTDTFLGQLKELLLAAYTGDEDEIRKLVAEVVPTYQPAGENGSEKKGKAFEEQMRVIEKNAAREREGSLV